MPAPESRRRLRLNLALECHEGQSRYRFFGLMLDGRQVLFVHAADGVPSPRTAVLVWGHCREGRVFRYCRYCGRASEPSCGCDPIG